MVLYSANLAELAVPVKKGKKQVEATEPTEKIPKEKKAPTEKQLAALAKAQETRKRKREEAEQAKEEAKKAIENEAKEQAEKEAQKEAKKQAAKEKRAAKKAKLETPPQTDDTGSFNEAEISKEIDEVLEKVPIKIGKKRAPKVKDETEPPKWFKQYIQGVKTEEQMITKEKKPKKQVRQEAEELAKESWNDGLTRDRVMNEVDNHQSRLFSQVFPGRQWK